MLDTPILFLIFNRPVFTQQVFAEIKKAQPKYLYIAADGPRDNKPGEQDLCNETRKIVIENIDWPCHVKTLFRSKNMGCGRAPAEAITWFFNEVEYGIILEDDCLPARSFFKFCEELLDRYKNDNRIVAISGTNLVQYSDKDSSYFFSVRGGNWGWASWRRCWLKFDYNISEWQNKDVKKKIRSFLKNDNIYNYYSKNFDWYLKNSPNDIWDYQWLFCRLANQGLSIVPSLNQVKNIGFGTNATHTMNSESKLAILERSELAFPLQSNDNVAADMSYDNIIYEEFIKPDLKINLKQKIVRRLKEFRARKKMDKYIIGINRSLK